MKQIALNLENCNGIGDLICSTPRIRKLHEYYGRKVTVISQHPELFKQNPDVEASYKRSSVDMSHFESSYIMHDSFYNVGKKNERGIEYKHNMIDIRQFHAIHLGFMLGKHELECFYRPSFPPDEKIIPSRPYVLIHPVSTWPTRTWDAEKWMLLTQMLNENGVAVVSIGKDSSETGFFNVQKPVFNFDIPLGSNLMNKTSISDCWWLISRSKCFVTMDSGLLHLAGTTDAQIVHLGSIIRQEFRAPYRKGGQSWRYDYIRGGCALECGSDAKHGIKEWGNIQGVAPLIKCLEGKATMECHPSVEQVFKSILTNL